MTLIDKWKVAMDDSLTPEQKKKKQTEDLFRDSISIDKKQAKKELQKTIDDTIAELLKEITKK